MKKDTLIIFATSSILITFFLFFIDEGYYNFKWMADLRNWIAFLIYIVPVFMGQVLVYKIIPRRYYGSGMTVLCVLFGASLGLLVVVKVIF